MPGNSNCVQIMSCADSPLSMTGSIIGILTFAYAIFFMAIFYANGFASANKEIEWFKRRLSREGASLELTKELLEHCRPMILEKFQPGFDLCIMQAHDSLIQIYELEQLLALPIRRPFIMKPFFVIGKKDISEALAAIADKRSHLEGIYQGVITRYHNSIPTLRMKLIRHDNLAYPSPRFTNRNGYQSTMRYATNSEDQY